MREDNYRDPHSVYEDRMGRFLATIKNYQGTNVRSVNEKADKEEEYWVNKIKQDAKDKDEESFRKMENAVKVAEKIFKSRKVNECRMSEMKVRFDMIERIQEEAKSHLKTKTQNQQEYRQLLKGLITQGLIKLLEEKVEIRCLRSDERLISEVMSECQRDFNDMCEVQTQIIINKQNYLTDQDIGGVVLTSFAGRIVCDNTLRARLSYCLQLLLPTIRSMMFNESDEYLGKKREEKKEREKLQKAKA